jgi:hypothetical protein
MRFAKRVFIGAGIWGLVVLTPLSFTFDLVGREYPPPITHPDLYYGFLGLGIAWQIGFLVIGRDPARFRPMMIPAVLEKFIFVLGRRDTLESFALSLVAATGVAIDSLEPGTTLVVNTRNSQYRFVTLFRTSDAVDRRSSTIFVSCRSCR